MYYIRHFTKFKRTILQYIQSISGNEIVHIYLKQALEIMPEKLVSGCFYQYCNLYNSRLGTA